MSSRLQQMKLGFFVKTNGVFSKPLYAGLGHILCFHRVLPPDGRPRITANSGQEISPGKLEWIIQYFINAGYEVITLDMLAEIVSGKRRPGRKFIVITFDDGYSDNYTFAYPLLKKMGVPFTIYVTTNYLENKAVMWWYFLEKYILENEQVRWPDGDEDAWHTAATLKEKELLFLKLRMNFINGGDDRAKEILDRYMGVTDEEIVTFCRDNSLNAGQLNELSADKLVTIGAHSITHRPLSKLSNDDAIYEIEGSKTKLEELTGKPVLHFSYPFGSPNEFGVRETEITARAGFTTCVSLQQGNIFKDHKGNLQRLPRYPLGEKVTEEYLRNICNGIRHYSFNGRKKII